jgi:hypothetical protein
MISHEVKTQIVNKTGVGFMDDVRRIITASLNCEERKQTEKNLRNWNREPSEK